MTFKPESINSKDGNRNPYDMTDTRNYEQDYEMPWSDKIEKIYEVPPIKDMAGVIARGIIKNDRQLNAMLRLAYRHEKFGDTRHQELLRMKVIGTAAIGGVARLEALFSATNLIASEMYRIARGMPKLKEGKEEKIHRGSDFRSEERPQESIERH